jgi:hypothetical protein
MVSTLRYLPFLTLAIASCNKNSDSSLREERLQLLINKKWQLMKMEMDSVGDNNTTIHREENYPFQNQWENDDYQLYRSDSTWEWNDNQMRDASGPQSITGTWYISDDGKKMFYKFDGFPDGGLRNIISLTATELKRSEVDDRGYWTQTYTYISIP